MNPYTLDAYMMVKSAIKNDESYETVIARTKRFIRLFDSEQGGATTDWGEVLRKAKVCRGAGICGNCKTSKY